MSSKLRIIVTGLIAQHPELGGVAWDYVQFPVGLARLGHDVYYFEDSGEWPYNRDGGPTGTNWNAYDCTQNVKHLAHVMLRFGLDEKWAYRFPIKPKWFGLNAEKRREVIKTADLLVNVSGTLERPEEYRQIPRLIYIDSDPAFTQIKLKLKRGYLKFQNRFHAHDVHFSFGEELLKSQKIPKTGHEWHSTRQPILLTEWHPNKPFRNIYTTVMSWTSYKPLRYANKTYGQKDLEFTRFLALPQLASPVRFEIALGNLQHTKWQTEIKSFPQEAVEWMRRRPDWTPQELLFQMGWLTTNALNACCDLNSYRDYIETSKAEWSVAKNGYVLGQSGWFSCRSACYLASGRPVVVQDTGFKNVIPVGKGILTFNSPEEAVSAVKEIEGNYPYHAQGAREIAEAYFDSDKVLAKLLDKVMQMKCQPPVKTEIKA